jgi:death-on-curing protein
MRYLSIREILELHDKIIEVSGGARGLRDIRALESAINQLRLTFDRTDLYPDILAKAAALCFFLVMNHPFVDGNKRIGHAAMETFLILNGFEIEASVDEQEQIILDLASGELTREYFTAWLNDHAINITNS